jgi:hypothetical protein
MKYDVKFWSCGIMWLMRRVKTWGGENTMRSSIADDCRYDR